MTQSLIPLELIHNRILYIRGQSVMLASDLAGLYDVEAKRINEQVKRNSSRFPDDFCFQLTETEFEILKSQFATSSWGGLRYAPYAFTEHGIMMLSSVLRSERAVQVNIAIMRAFVKMREFMLTNREMALRLDAMEARYDDNFKIVFDTLRDLMKEHEEPKHPVGFQVRS